MNPGAHDIDDPPPTAVPYFTVESVGDRVPHVYVGLLMASGSSGFDAIAKLEKRSVEMAQREHQRLSDSARVRPGRHSYAVVGVRITAGTSSSGQPEWIAYGTLVQIRREVRPEPTNDMDRR